MRATNSAGPVAHLKAQMSEGHLWSALQQGQSSPGALIDISAFVA